MMKISPFLCFALAASSLFSCGQKSSSAVVKGTDKNCKDTMTTFVFVNKASMEVKLHMFILNTHREGNTIINTWSKFKNYTVIAGDSFNQQLNVNRKYMYDLYGPVSTNVNGVGIVFTEKLLLLPCKIYTSIYKKS